VRDVVVSGGDVANVPWRQLETYLMGLLSVPTVRDIRLATKALMGLPQHWLQGDVVEGLNRVGQAWQGRPALSAQQIEDVVAFLATLRTR